MQAFPVFLSQRKKQLTIPTINVVNYFFFIPFYFTLCRFALSAKGLQRQFILNSSTQRLAGGFDVLQPAFSERPRIVEQASYTKAAPVKEKKHFRRVSDSIGNNYSPGANKFTTSLIYNTTRGGKQDKGRPIPSIQYLLMDHVYGCLLVLVIYTELSV